MDEAARLQQANGRKAAHLEFLRGFLRRPAQVGSVVPSSRYLERRLVEMAGVARARHVVELGPGTGGTTRAVLDALPRDGRLVAVEIDPRFAALLGKETDPRLSVHQGSAEHLREVLHAHGLPGLDVVISGIPFSTLPPASGRRILRAVWDCLRPGGCFVAYQFRGHVAELDRELLGKPQVEMELRNIPPMRVYRWLKTARAVRAERRTGS